jgi:hypothetical protein
MNNLTVLVAENDERQASLIARPCPKTAASVGPSGSGWTGSFGFFSLISDDDLPGRNMYSSWVSKCAG